MADQTTIDIEIAYATPGRQEIFSLAVALSTTARAALLQSGLQRKFPEIDPARCDIGVFGRLVADDHALADGDRLEVYRPLIRDPREARRLLAARGETMRRR